MRDREVWPLCYVTSEERERQTWNDIQTEKENARKDVGKEKSKDSVDKQNSASAEKSSLTSELNEITEVVNNLKEKTHQLEEQVKLPLSDVKLKGIVKQLIEQESNEKWKQHINGPEAKAIVNE